MKCIVVLLCIFFLLGCAKIQSSNSSRSIELKLISYCGVSWKTGLASPSEKYRPFFAERSPWWLVIKAFGAPGHGAKLYDNSAMENLLKSIESVRRFRASQFDLVKSGLKEEGEVISVNMVFLKAGTPSPTVSFSMSFATITIRNSSGKILMKKTLYMILGH